MALKGTAELHEEFEELRSTTWFQALLAAACILLLSSAFSLYTLWVANCFLIILPCRFFPTVCCWCWFYCGFAFILAISTARIMRRCWFCGLCINTVRFWSDSSCLGVCFSLLVPLNFFSEGGQVQQYTCQVLAFAF